MKVLKNGSDMASSIKSKNNSAKGILNLLEFSHIIFTYAKDKANFINKNDLLL